MSSWSWSDAALPTRRAVDAVHDPQRARAVPRPLGDAVLEPEHEVRRLLEQAEAEQRLHRQ